MSKFNYTEQAATLAEVIDIAINSVRKFPPSGFNETHVNHFVNTYLEFKKSVVHPEPKYANIQSLAYTRNDVFTYFQEGSGDTVNYFWKQLNERQLPFRRENKLTKILERKKIKNRIEYDFVKDVCVAYVQKEIITLTEANQLEQMMTAFENNSRKV
jgi:hypothetical protein